MLYPVPVRIAEMVAFTFGSTTMLGVVVKLILPRAIKVPFEVAAAEFPVAVISYRSVLNVSPEGDQIVGTAPLVAEGAPGIVTAPPEEPQKIALLLLDHTTSAPSPGVPAPPSHQFKVVAPHVPVPPRFAPVEASFGPGEVVERSGSQYRLAADA